MSADILLEHADRVVSLTLDRQEALNAITPGMLDIIERAMAQAGKNKTAAARLLGYGSYQRLDATRERLGM